VLPVEKLSELGATSDKFGASRRKAVRTRGNFGQVWRSQTKSCLNQGQLRTGLVLLDEKLSESGPTSDRFGAPRRKAV
ncbi:hypothetical protein J7E34_13300, partial [Chryseobacterium sp. ISL-80]|nr:hypothetical protein [Chryseobacterium sp. ISL-80]